MPLGRHQHTPKQSTSPKVECLLCGESYHKRGLKTHQRGSKCIRDTMIKDLLNDGWEEFSTSRMLHRDLGFTVYLKIWPLLTKYKLEKRVQSGKERLTFFKKWVMMLAFSLVERGYNYTDAVGKRDNEAPLYVKMDILLAKGEDDIEVQSLVIERALTL